MLGIPKIAILPLLQIASLLCLAQPSSCADHAVVLQYHHFGGDTPPSTSVTLEQFDAHLAYLAEHDYAVWPLERIVGHLQKGEAVPENCVAITIDDAYVSVYERAFPRLKARGWPFTVFVPTEGVDRAFDSYMTWEQMREMQPFGATFASHSHTHAYLVRRLPGESDSDWKQRVTGDIETSLARLEEELGQASTLFAYPYGEYDLQLREIVLDLGLTGFGQHSGGIWPGSDFGALPRFPLAVEYAEMQEFVTKVRSLPLPVLSRQPEDPLLAGGDARPVLRLEIGPGIYRIDSIACYVSGQGSVPVRWIDKDRRVFEVVARESLPVGRSRYNITALHEDGARYYWYSHLWIRPSSRNE